MDKDSYKPIGRGDHSRYPPFNLPEGLCLGNPMGESIMWHTYRGK